MKIFHHTIIVGIMLIFIASCTTTSSTLDSEDLGRTYVAEYDEVFSEAINAVSSLSWELEHSEKDAGLIQAETPTSLFTYGDKVSIRVVEEDTGKVNVNMTSGTDQAIDWGKNEKNIKDFFSKLDELLEDQQE